ncbi:MAG: type II toxin-antitoxin system HicB family antitoxin [Proteobacteria bacterium]|nr:type II toxin-antitoxin system HicB family antitoxin [Pseudomonadota bacterium]
MHKFYYAVFEKENEGYLVSFPDLKGCNTFAETMEKAIAAAEDALAGWLEAAEPAFIKKPSTYETITLRHQGENITVMAVPVRRDLMLTYAPKQKVNLSLSVTTVELIDFEAKKRGLNRSAYIDALATQKGSDLGV